MTRLFSRISVSLLAVFAGSVVLGSCTQAIAPALPPQDFAQVRVLNFTLSDPSSNQTSVPLDIYMDEVGTTPDSLARINGLAYGQASVYSNNLPTAPGGTQYMLVARPLRQKNVKDASQTVTLMPGQRYTWLIWADTQNYSLLKSQLIPDGVQPANADPANHTYVRFINAQPGTGSLQLSVNDPNSSLVIPSSGGSTYMQSTDYVALNTAPDTSFTFFVTNANDPTRQIISRLAFNSFAAGSYHTVVYGGDPVRIAARPPSGDAVDSFRIRVFDDNTAGNDQTFPIPLSFRYFIVNSLVPTAVQTPFVGFLVNNDPLPNFHNLSFPPTPTFGVAAGNVAQDPTDPTVTDVYAQSAILTDAIDLKGFAIPDTAASSSTPLFDIHAGRRGMVSDRLYSIVFMDTVTSKFTTDSLRGEANTTVALPDQSIPGSVQIVFVSAIAAAKGVTASQNYGHFFYNGTADDYLNGSGNVGAKPGRYDLTPISIPYDGSSIKITGAVGSASSNVTVPELDFTPANGGIYEVILVGQRNNNPHFLVFRVNP